MGKRKVRRVSCEVQGCKNAFPQRITGRKESGKEVETKERKQTKQRTPWQRKVSTK